jgi:putative tryptophan/tyrosine transport system substrate-binding protein
MTFCAANVCLGPGENPVELPVEKPTKLDLMINQRAAAAFGLTVPAMLLARADEGIE